MFSKTQENIQHTFLCFPMYFGPNSTLSYAQPTATKILLHKPSIDVLGMKVQTIHEKGERYRCLKQFTLFSIVLDFALGEGEKKVCLFYGSSFSSLTHNIDACMWFSDWYCSPRIVILCTKGSWDMLRNSVWASPCQKQNKHTWKL